MFKLENLFYVQNKEVTATNKFCVVLACDNFYNPQLAHLLDIILMLIIVIIFIGQVHKQKFRFELMFVHHK